MRLHKEKGLNPHKTFCPKCGKESDELILLGAVDYKYECSSCGRMHIGRPKSGVCSCGMTLGKGILIGDFEVLPASDFCDACQEELLYFKAEVMKGEVFWKCDTCGNSGVIVAGFKLAVLIRKELRIEPPGLCGIDFTDDANGMCPVCNKRR